MPQLIETFKIAKYCLLCFKKKCVAEQNDHFLYWRNSSAGSRILLLLLLLFWLIKQMKQLYLYLVIYRW